MCGIAGIIGRIGDRNRAARQPLREIFPIDELHHQRPIFNAIHLRDVGMIQRRERLRLACESRQALRIAREQLRKNLDRDIAVQARIAGAIHLPHSTGADVTGDLVRPDTIAALHARSILPRACRHISRK